ncbi:MAG: hypothetical protein N4A71_05720 [Carboxylicivirga sp.]|jgi:hypothetical protein|nr:hypothetical protein [Carboxylicivirga sp.]
MNQFVTLCSDSEYFRQKPYKQAGIEKKTTSLAFPYTIEGTKDDVLKMFAFLDDYTEKSNNCTKNQDISIIELEALAELELLELLKI